MLSMREISRRGLPQWKQTSVGGVVGVVGVGDGVGEFISEGGVSEGVLVGAEGVSEWVSEGFSAGLVDCWAVGIAGLVGGRGLDGL